MRHLHYYKIAAKTHFELGFTLGKLFKSPSLDTYNAILSKTTFSSLLLSRSQSYLEVSTKYFPQYVEELQGYAKGIGIDFKSFWMTFLNEEFDIYPDKCTSCYANMGMLMGHNEDFDDHYKKRITILEKTIGDITILELYYYNSLGGTAASINSFGFTQTINTLHHTDGHVGVPRNIIARWLSETKDPEGDFKKLKEIPRSLGYNHTFSSPTGKLWNIESTAREARLTKPEAPYAHTNHYFSDLKKYEDPTQVINSNKRYNFVLPQLNPRLKREELEQILKKASYLDEEKKKGTTIARFIINREKKAAFIWLKREMAKGWVSYSLPHL